MRKHESSQKSTGRWIVRLELILLLAFVCAAASRELRGRSVRQEQRNEAADSGLTAENGEAIEVSATGNYITGAKHGGKFDRNSVREIETVAGKLRDGETTMDQLTKDMEYYEYYLEAYSAVLSGMVGEFSLEEDGKWKRYYGLKAFSPVAKGFDYSHYDDFGSSRSYGYSRPHLGHDMMGQIGTPIIAIESGVVEALGWNQYGGWRIGIRSFDGKRYYYYAHLRQNYPYAEGLAEGDVVTAGDVIGYMGHTGYSVKENVNNIETVHLHWGLQLIFDESQKEGNNEIWIDCYELTKFLYRSRSEVAKVEDSKEWRRVQEMQDPAVEKRRKKEVAGFLFRLSEYGADDIIKAGDFSGNGRT